MTQIFLLK